MSLDGIVSKIVGMGVPGLVLLIVMSISGYAGAAALTAALSTLGGPLGMLGGIAVLGFLLIMAKGLSEFGFEVIFTKTIEGLQEKGETKESIINKINKYPISKTLKITLIDKINKLLDN